MLSIFIHSICLLSLINIIVLVHELGHYIVAKMFGVHVDLFCLGIGRPILKVNLFETKWVLCMLPFGGSVSISEDDSGVLKGTVSLHPLKNLLIILAGPFFNFMFFMIGYFFVFCNLFYSVDKMQDIDFSKDEVQWLNTRLEVKKKKAIRLNIIDCFKIIGVKTRSIFKNIGHAKLIGPVGILKNLKIAMGKDKCALLYYIANLSLFFGVLNLVPLSVLDGGMGLICLYTFIFRRKVSDRGMFMLTYVSIILVGCAFFSVTLQELLPFIERLWS